MIYPLAREETSEKNIVKSEMKTLFGYGGCVSTFGVPIPAADSYKDFCQAMKEIEADMKFCFTE